MEEYMRSIASHLVWVLVAVVGAFGLGVIALHNGEKINALWILVVSVSVYLIAYRYYSRFIARRVLQLDATRMTPAYRHNDGLDYVPTNQYVLFGHHFAAIAGAGPLVGPVLAAQMGYLPGMIWILAGVVLAGAVQDFMVLFVSMRRDGRSLGELIKQELGAVPGVIALFGTFMIMIIILAVLALIVVKALTHSPWGAFTVACTIPLALFMGIYLRYIRPGKIGEVSVIGFVLLMASIVYGGDVAHSPALAPLFNLDGRQLTWTLMIYGGVASILPVWLLLAPRDYLSTFLKVGTIAGLAVGIVFIAPTLEMPAMTRFVDGSGPVWSGTLFPFLFITIACGAVSGFHALIASGTTPKMLENESQAAFIGYGGMLLESFVAIMALIAASVIDPGIYFAMNSPVAALGGSTVEAAAATVSSWGFEVTPDMLTHYAQSVGESSIVSRAGGAPTLAVGMAHILSQAAGFISMAFWYHFAILFEALFILTAVDAGTRAGRFMLQDLLGVAVPSLKRTDSLAANVIATALCVAAWGYFLYQGVVDPLGGINTLWPLFGIANQMLAAMALTLCFVVLFKMKRHMYAWVAGVPMLFLLVCTTSAGLTKIFSADPRVGFLALADKYQAGIAQNHIIGPAKTLAEMQRLVFNNQLNAALTALFIFVMISVLLFGLRTAYQAYQLDRRSDREVSYQALPTLK
jgi:carbon starvation protein